MRIPSARLLFSAVALWCLTVLPDSEAQVSSPFRLGHRFTRRPGGTYGPGMSFGRFAYAMNYGYAFGSPYGGLGTIGYGLGSGVGPGFGPGGSILYSSAYNAPGTNSAFSGYYPPFAAYGWAHQNSAIFPPPAPNYGPVGVSAFRADRGAARRPRRAAVARAGQ